MRFVLLHFVFPGIIGGSILLRFGIKKTIIAGTLLSSVGLFSSSFATNVYVMYVTFGLLPGKCHNKREREREHL